ncbi:MAG: DUF4129 domain-containing protein [Mycobacterium sp.]|uniref:DUF4129 domain-containing protein n=1 Tax=Mycobacterium sp. TaxID=1785 RepID=UPI003CC5E960
MPDKATSRVIALIVLLIVVAAALHGYLPGGRRTPPREHAGNSAVSLALVVALLAVSLAVIVIAVISRLRQPRAAGPAVGSLSDGLGGNAVRPSWRVLLIGLALMTGWLLLVALATHLLQRGVGAQVSTTGPSTLPSAAHVTAAPPSAAPKAQPDTGGHVLPYLAASTVVLLVVLVGATLVASRKRPQEVVAVADDGAPASASPLEPKSLARAAERGLAEIGDLSLEPREAIIACYAAMERELAQIPGSAPQAFDTPTEVLARAVAHRSLSTENAVQLVNLFAEARFSPHVMNEQHREIAVNALQVVLVELSAQAGRPG